MWPSADALPLTAPQRNALHRLVRGRNTTQKMVLRAHIVLRCAQGLANHAMARELGVNRKTVILCVKGGVNLDHFGGAKVDQLVKG